MISKTWGYEATIVNTPKYAAKFLFVLRDRYCSIHRHHIKDETFLVLKGTIKLELNKTSAQVLRAGDKIRILPFTWHRFIAVENDAVILEIPTHDSDDTERFELSIDLPLVETPKDLHDFLQCIL